VVFGNSTLANRFPATVEVASQVSPASLSFTGDAVLDRDRLGMSVKGVGDVNGDGYEDLVVAGHQFSWDSVMVPHSGGAFLIYGRATPVDLTRNSFGSSDGVIIYSNSTSYTDVGHHVWSAGDFNGDGFADLWISSPNNVNEKSSAYIVFGGKSLPSSIDVHQLSQGTGMMIVGEVDDKMGDFNVAHGDVNNDGYSDVIVGCWNSNSGAGKVIVITGSANPPAFYDAVAQNPFTISTNDSLRFGYFVWSGDYNKDGHLDILIAASTSSYVFFGDLPPSPSPVTTLSQSPSLSVSPSVVPEYYQK